jgi:hypothetical protein
MTTNLPSTQQAMTTGLPQLGLPSKVFAQLPQQNDMAQGVGVSFGLLTFRGKVWRIKFRGEEHALVLPPAVPGGPPAGPKPTCEVVIVKASPAISKVFYKDGYAEGDKEAPDCMSTNGQTPDPASPEKQCTTCAACPMNAWGSKMMPSGKPGKACQDSKRLAIVPADDMANEMFGGPMLLRVPAASLQDMAAFSSMMQQHGYPYYGVVVSLSFDMQNAYPKLVFTAVRGLNDAEAAKVIELQNDHRVTRILSEAVDTVRHEAPALTGPGMGVAAGPGAPPAAISVQPQPAIVGGPPLAGSFVPQPAIAQAQPVMPVAQPQPVPQPAVVAVPQPAQQPVVTQVQAGEMPPIPPHLQRPIVTQPVPVQPAPVEPSPALQQVQATVAPQTAEQQIAELQAKLAALSAGQPATPPTTTRRKSRGTAAATPSPAPTEAGGAPVVAMPAPVTTPPVQPAATGFITAPAQPGVLTQVAAAPTVAEQDLDAQLDSLLAG